ncbi:hypothetical protein PN498_18445 [Oscillatoria sp. CS-180]|uniref:hypothetical protein n=1 Tax=Oscillatoria sp. CS-180 TaxID=3021720 RepID=UPI00232AD33C|nr:hypothetical protein [Oscillatoria sp. CS-180]MDB9527980.1 hypothetical protein [Oscillatoria sp. CS-180]
MAFQNFSVTTRWRALVWATALCLTAGCSAQEPVSDRADVSPKSDMSTPQQTSEAAENWSDKSPSSEAFLESTNVSKANSSSSSQLAQAIDSDLTIVPGERVGPVSETTSRADLAEIFGEAALDDTEIAVGEGFTESGTVVNAGTDQAFSVIWLDNDRTQPLLIRDFGSAWQLSEGIQIGTSFSRLQTLLGSFDLYGFGWDYGGTVVLEGSNLEAYYGMLILRLQPDSAAIAQSSEALQAVQGDELFSSDNPNLAMLNLTVDEMLVYLSSVTE